MKIPDTSVRVIETRDATQGAGQGSANRASLRLPDEGMVRAGR